MKTTTTTAAAVALLAFAGCQDVMETPGTVAMPEATVPGDPAFYAPEGWPLQIGDEITEAERQQMYENFPSLSNGGCALHLIGDVVYSAKWGWSNDGGHGRIYEGHFPASVPMRYKDREHTLPPRFHGRITYGPYGLPIPPHLDEEWRISTIGGGRPPKDGNR